MIGVDLVSISRIEKMIERFGDKALKKYLSQSEIDLIKSAKTAAGFWAVKEAVSKSLGCGISSELGFMDIRISKTLKNAPLVTLSDKAKQHHNVSHIAISITHDEGLAIAVAFTTFVGSGS
jgi:holo-[acyl-carrier protein] synthase